MVPGERGCVICYLMRSSVSLRRSEVEWSGVRAALRPTMQWSLSIPKQEAFLVGDVDLLGEA